jgi:hypothetical protein
MKNTGSTSKAQPTVNNRNLTSQPGKDSKPSTQGPTQDKNVKQPDTKSKPTLNT